MRYAANPGAHFRTHRVTQDASRAFLLTREIGTCSSAVTRFQIGSPLEAGRMVYIRKRRLGMLVCYPARRHAAR